MSQPIVDSETDFPLSSQRSAWRQRFVDAERGIVSCFRSNSAMFVYFFAICMLLSTATVVELSILGWAVAIFCVVFIIAGELVYDSINKIVQLNREKFSKETLELLNRINTAFMLMIFGAFLTISFILVMRIIELEWF